MRWKEKVLKKGDTRVIECFLFLPRCIHEECRWLEKARIHQKLYDGPLTGFHWYDIGWVDEQAQEQGEP